MVATKAAKERLARLRGRAGPWCVGFRFEGAIGTCRASSPILKPVREPVDGASVFLVGDVALYAVDDFAEVLQDASFDYDRAIFGSGLTVSWPHRDSGCPNCR